MDANAEALDNLMSNLKEHGYDFNKIPYVLQLNKRDLPNVLPVEALTKELRRKNEPVLEAIAFQGQGVFETLKEIARQVLVELKQGGEGRPSAWACYRFYFYAPGLINPSVPSCPAPPHPKAR